MKRDRSSFHSKDSRRKHQTSSVDKIDRATLSVDKIDRAMQSRVKFAESRFNSSTNLKLKSNKRHKRSMDHLNLPSPKHSSKNASRKTAIDDLSIKRAKMRQRTKSAADHILIPKA